MKLIAISNKDLASKNIGKFLLKNYPFIKKGEFYTFKNINIIKCKEDVLELDYLEKYSPELLLIASPHKSVSRKPSLTCHVPGNWSNAEYGGRNQKLSIAPALFIREVIMNFIKEKIPGFEVSLEVTHHGPSIDVPTLFVEIGSSEEQWKNLLICEKVAKVIFKTLTNKPEEVPVAIGFGGTHYGAKFNKFISSVAFGHICPKYAADSLNESMILKAFEKTIPKPSKALLDWKGLTSYQREKIIHVLNKKNISWEKI